MKGTRPLDNTEIRQVSACFTGAFEVRNRKKKMEVLTLMRRFFSTLIILLIVFLLYGCGADENETQDFLPANFISASPPGGEIAANGTITVTFDKAPAAVTVNMGTVTVAGKTATIAGPFTPGHLALTITWADGTQALNYMVASPD